MPKAPPPTEPRLSESDVQAFADGMLDPAQAARVQTYLKTHPDEAHRVAFYGRLNAQMQNAFPDPVDEAPPPKPARRISKPSLRKLLIATVAALALATAAIFAFDISDSALDNASMMALEQAVAAQDMASGASGYESSAKALASAPGSIRRGIPPDCPTGNARGPIRLGD